MNEEMLGLIFRNEAAFWMSIPAGQAGGPGQLIPSLLLRLADAVEAEGIARSKAVD